MRHIREIENLPIKELTDEEIVKATLYHLDAKAVMLVYSDDDGNYFMGRYKKGGYALLRDLRTAWQDKFGKLTRLVEED